MTESIGSLTALNGAGTLEDISLEIDRQSSEKLAEALTKGQPARDDQDLFFKSIVIPNEKLERKRSITPHYKNTSRCACIGK